MFSSNRKAFHVSSHFATFPKLIAIFAVIVGTFSPCGVSAADVPPPADISTSGLSGLSRIALPTSPAPQLMINGDAGYSYTESVGSVPGAHHGLTGHLTIGAQFAPWLGAALGFDGKMLFHPDDADGADNSMLGTPRLQLRSGATLKDILMLGGAVNIKIPGTGAPSLEWDATTLDLLALFAVAPAHSHFTIASHAGFRIDNTINATPSNLDTLRPGDRMALEISEFNAVLLGVGLSYHLGLVTLVGEFTTDLLVGNGAPVASSPFRFDIGARLHLLKRMQVSLMTETNVGGRPDMAPEDPLVPIEPRFAVTLGLGYTFDFSNPSSSIAPQTPAAAKKETAATPIPVPAPVPPPADPVATSSPAPRHTVKGTLIDADQLPIAGANVRITISIGDFSAEVTSDKDGVFRFDNVPEGEATIKVSAKYFEDMEWQVTVGADSAETPPVTLKERVLGSQLRGQVRSGSGEPLQVTVHLTPGSAQTRSDKAGNFIVDVAPGTYTVTIKEKGYHTLKTTVKIEENGVTILNLDLMKAADKR